MSKLTTLGLSDLKVARLSFGTSTFGGAGRFFSAWGNTDAREAHRMVDICLDAGVNLFDSADVYSDGMAEEILGAAIKGRRDKVIIATKTGLPLEKEPESFGASRSRLIRAVDRSLKRLGTDYIDLFQLHGFDGFTPVEETLETFETLVSAGKIRYIGASNYSGWQLMKSLAIADSNNWPRYISHQAHYSLLNRKYEWELMPLAHDQNVGTMVWSPLAWGRLTGKIRREQGIPDNSRLGKVAHWGLPVNEEKMYDVIDVLLEIASETGNSVPQIALAWLLSRPTVTSVILGARNEKQLVDNLGALDCNLSSEQIERLDKVSQDTPPPPYYAYYHDRSYRKLCPPLLSDCRKD